MTDQQPNDRDGDLTIAGAHEEFTVTRREAEGWVQRLMGGTEIDDAVVRTARILSVAMELIEAARRPSAPQLRPRGLKTLGPVRLNVVDCERL